MQRSAGRVTLVKGTNPCRDVPLSRQQPASPRSHTSSTSNPQGSPTSSTNSHPQQNTRRSPSANAMAAHARSAPQQKNSKSSNKNSPFFSKTAKTKLTKRQQDPIASSTASDENDRSSRTPAPPLRLQRRPPQFLSLHQLR